MSLSHFTTQQSKTQNITSPTIHLHQELVESLLLLRVGETWHIGGALLPHSVNLIYVDDARRPSTGLFKQAPDPGSAETYTQPQCKSQSIIKLLLQLFC